MIASLFRFLQDHGATETSATAKFDVKLATLKFKKKAKCGNKLDREPCGTE